MPYFFRRRHRVTGSSPRTLAASSNDLVAGQHLPDMPLFDLFQGNQVAHLKLRRRGREFQGQVLPADLVIVAEQHGALDGVAQFPDIAGPGIIAAGLPGPQW